MSGAIKKFEIHLDHDIDEQYQYEPGETLSGSVVLTLGEDMFIKTITVQIRGEATVGLDDEHGKSSSDLRASEVYVDETVKVYDEDKATMLSRGNHSFPLTYNLPENLPSSFIGKMGSITYVVRATLKQGHENQIGLGSTIASEPFLILRSYDLAKDQELSRPRAVKLSKRSSCSLIFCNNGKLNAEFQVSKTGYLPGEDIIVNAQINNDYPSNIKSVTAVLLLNSNFHAKNQSRQYSQVVNKKLDSLPVEYGGERVWTDLRLPIPPFIPESNLFGCALIDIQYVLQFLIEFDDETDTEVSLPIVIGTPVDNRRKGNKQQWNETDYPISTGNNYILESDNLKIKDIGTKDLEKFRHPMKDGEMKENIFFQDDD